MKEEKRGKACAGSACPYKNRCDSFFEHLTLMYANMNSVFRYLYCKKYFKKCARYYYYHKGGKKVLPSDLFPNQEIRAHTYLKDDRVS